VSFFEDLHRGKLAEREVLCQIKTKYPCAVQVTDFTGYDIWIPETSQSVEVKYDHASVRTGNFVVEIEMAGKPSGLLTTNADLWVFYDGEIFAWITPRDIFRCILVNRLQYKEFFGGEDKNSKKAYLVPKPLLFSYAALHKKLEDFL
jgi:hypothetical protein